VTVTHTHDDTIHALCSARLANGLDVDLHVNVRGEWNHRALFDLKAVMGAEHNTAVIGAEH